MSKIVHLISFFVATESLNVACGIDLEPLIHVDAGKNSVTSNPDHVNCENCMASIVANKMAPLYRSGISMTMANQIFRSIDEQLKGRTGLYKKGLL